MWGHHLTIIGITATVMAVAAGCGSRQPVPERSKQPPRGSHAGCPTGPDNAKLLECIEHRPLAAPLVVGPGRIRLAVEPSWAPDILDPRGTLKEDDAAFVLVDVTPTGQRVVASGHCPSASMSSEPVSMSILRDGSTGVLCTEPATARGAVADIENENLDAAIAHFGVVNETSATIEWRWHETLSADSEWAEAGVWDHTAVVADLGDVAVVLYATKSCGGKDCLSYGPLRFQLVPGGASRPLCYLPEAPDEPPTPSATVDSQALCPRVVRKIFVDSGGLHVLASDDDPWHALDRPYEYHHFTVAADGDTSARLLSADDEGPGEPSPESCSASGLDRSLVLKLPLARLVPTDEHPVGSYTLTLRRQQAWFPLGPDVLPSELRSCPPRVGRHPLKVYRTVRRYWEPEWLRASHGDGGWVVVYYVRHVPHTNSSRAMIGDSFRIERHERWVW